MLELQSFFSYVFYCSCKAGIEYRNTDNDILNALYYIFELTKSRPYRLVYCVITEITIMQYTSIINCCAFP